MSPAERSSALPPHDPAASPPASVWEALKTRIPAVPLAIKIVFPILIAVISLAIVGRYGYLALVEQRETLRRDMLTYAAGLEQAAELPNHLVAVRAGLYKLSVWGIARLPSDDLTAIKTQIRRSVLNAEGSLSRLEREGLDRSGETRGLFDRYRKAVEQALALIERSPIVGATAARGLEKLYYELEEASERLAQSAAARFDARNLVASRNAKRFVERFALIALIFFAISTLLGLIVAFRISHPIRRLTRTIGELQGGAFDAAIPYCGRRDEIGAVARALERFAETLKARSFLEAELRRQKDQALELAAAAEAASLAKSSFLANMSHEIRTPLNGILGMAQILENEPLTPLQLESTQTILESGKTLMVLLNDVLDLSKIEAGKLNIEQTAGDLRHVFGHLQRLFLPRAQEKSLALTIKIRDDLPERLRFDHIRVSQCVSNLLSNAIKFTNQGSVEVTVNYDLLGPAHYLIRVTVTDSGIGISEEEIGRLFLEFSQADNSTTRKYGGTGLGLTITKRLARLMGGDIFVASVPGGGSTFTFTFQAAAEAVREDRPRPVRKTRAGDGVLQGVRLLLVDDNAINRKVARMLLAPSGGGVTEAANGSEALHLLASQPFDLVLLDIHMPIMDGLETIRRIRGAEQSWRSIPVIALTADAMSGDRERLLSAGMNGYASKPIDQLTLLAEIQRVLDEHAAPGPQKPGADIEEPPMRASGHGRSAGRAR